MNVDGLKMNKKEFPPNKELGTGKVFPELSYQTIKGNYKIDVPILL